MTVAGYYTYFIIRMTQEQKVGIEAVQQPITFNDFITAVKGDGVTPYSPEFYITDCQPQPSGWGDTVWGTLAIQTGRPNYPAENVTQSGTCTYTRSDPANNTSQYSFSITGADLSGTRFPTSTYGGQDLSAGPFIDIEQRVQIFIPFRTIDASDGAIDGAGALKFSNEFGGFDPTGLSGTSNYGDGVEPGYCPASGGTCNLMSNGLRSNNVVGPTEFRVVTAGSMSKYMTYRYDNWAGYQVTPGMVNAHDGGGLIEPGDYSGAMVNFANNGANPLNNPGVCDVFDNTVYTLTTADKINLNNTLSLTPAVAASTYAYVSRYNGIDFNYATPFSVGWPSNWRLEYGHIPISGDDPLYRAASVGTTGVINSTVYPGVDTYNTATGRYEGVWANPVSYTHLTLPTSDLV